ncbi:MAG: hypothetical protein DRN05_05975 [Thermoplasmata archaeon]|nr:MAG: hypothetical protein DRN05_05975 [Thermoplasmata archaeon]
MVHTQYPHYLPVPFSYTWCSALCKKGDEGDEGDGEKGRTLRKGLRRLTIGMIEKQAERA